MTFSWFKTDSEIILREKILKNIQDIFEKKKDTFASVKTTISSNNC